MHSSDPMSPAERESWLRWNADPRAQKEFIEANMTAVVAQELDGTVDRARITQWETAPVDERAHSRKQIFKWWAVAATIIGVMVIGGIVAQSEHLFGGKAYVTRTGEQRTVTFQEGSVAYLNTRTELRWAGTGKERRVEMSDGEALFDVVHDDAHPFSVILDNSEIRVLGTRFNVYHKPGGDTIVTVLEGTVEVRGLPSRGTQAEWVRRVHANEQIEYRSIGLLREPHATDAQSAVRWRQGIYKFRDESIEHVLEELTRYTDQRIVIRDPRIAERHIGGALSTRDVRGALKHLEDMAPIAVHEGGGTFTLDYRDPGSADTAPASGKE
jgi:transmembrane sensor